MARANSDGSIILSTSVDTSGVKSGIKALKGLASAIGVAFSVTAIVRFSNEAGKLATQVEASQKRLIDIYGEASDALGDFIDQNARALGMSKSAAASYASVYGNLFSVWADQQTNAALTTHYLNMTAVVASKTGRTVEDVQERVRSGLLGNTEAIEDLGIFVNVKTIEMTDAFKRMADGKSWEQLDAYAQQQIRTMAILEQATDKYGTEVADTSATVRSRFNAAWQDFQATWGQVVNKVLIPALEVLTQVLDVGTRGLQQIFNISDSTIDEAESIDKAAENQKKLTEEIEETNKVQKKSLAGFDEIQKLSAETALGEVNGDTSGIPPYQGGDDGGKKISETLVAIMGVVGMALVAVGLILLFTGNIAYGIGFIIAGAATLAVTMAAASSFEYDGVIQMITTIMGIAGGALLALGIILLWIGGVVGKPIAIGMIIAGAALIIGAVAAQAAFAPKDVKAWLSIITGIAGGAMLALGIILCMAGSLPLGIGLIIAGAVSLVAAFALKSDAVVKALQGPIGKIVAIVGGILLVLGIILACTGVALPLGIALIAAGAVSLVAVVALNWDAVFTWVKNAFNTITSFIESHGLAMLILGLILCFTGVALPIGLALIVFGVKGMVQGKDPVANALLDWIKGVWEAVKAFWNQYIAPIFTAKFWLDLAKKCGNGLIEGFEKAINGIIGMFEKMINWIVDGLNKISFDVPEWVPGIGGNKFGFDIDRVSFDRVSIPRLATGTVLPGGKPYLAWVNDQPAGQTNIEAPLATIKQGVYEVMAELGITSGTNEAVIEVDGETFGRLSYKHGKSYARRVGANFSEG